MLVYKCRTALPVWCVGAKRSQQNYNYESTHQRVPRQGISPSLSGICDRVAGRSERVEHPGGERGAKRPNSPTYFGALRICVAQLAAAILWPFGPANNCTFSGYSLVYTEV